MNAVLIGAPGAGKGTQAAVLRTKYGFSHVASGDLLREAVRQQTALGLTAKHYMDRGELVPDEVVIRMILERLRHQPASNGVIFDGFPRTLEQARALEQALAAMNQQIDVVLYLDVPRETLMERLTQRYQCGDCGAIFNWGVNPPRQEGLCDECGGGLYQRMDDNERLVGRRLEAYFSQTMPLIKHYATTGQLHRVEGTGSIVGVTAHILAVLGHEQHEQQG